MRLDDCLRIINRRLRTAQDEVARRKRHGLQSRPWQHRIQELEAVRREIAALATPEAIRNADRPRPAQADRAWPAGPLFVPDHGRGVDPGGRVGGE